MPREKEGKQKTKGPPLPIIAILQKFLKTYEKHCAQTQTSVCPAIRRDLKTSIDNEQILKKVSECSPFLILLWNELTRVNPKEHGSSVLSSPELVTSPPSTFLPEQSSAPGSDQEPTLLPLLLCHSHHQNYPSQSFPSPSDRPAFSHTTLHPEWPICPSSHSTSGKPSSKAPLPSSFCRTSLPSIRQPLSHAE